MPQPDVIYLVEHVARELDIACAVRYLVGATYGLDVQIRSLLDPPHSGDARAHPAVLATPYFYSRDDAGLRTWLDRYPRASVVNLALEQLFSAGNRRFKRPRDDAARQHVTHLASGDLFRDFLLEYGVATEHVALTGNLPCGLYRPPYRDYFAGRRAEFAHRYGLDPARPWVFFPENFGAAFFGPGAIRQRIRLGAQPEDVYAYRNFSQASFAAIMPWCRAAAETGHIELIIRPRPSSPREAFVDAYRDAAGVVPDHHLHFLKSESVREWSLASDLVVSSYSSSLLEAAVAGKPVFLLAPIPFCASVQTDWCATAPAIRNQQQFLHTITHIPSLSTDSALQAWANRNLLAAGDPVGNLARLLAAICNGTRRAPEPPPPLPWSWRARLWARTTARDLERQLRQWTGRRNRLRAAMHEDDRFTLEEVARRTDRWAQVLNSHTRATRAPIVGAA